jgi:hypothetical protein
MSNGDLKIIHAVPAVGGTEENDHELTEWNASAVEATVFEPAKLRSRLRIIAVLAGLNVSTCKRQNLGSSYSLTVNMKAH